MLAFVHIEKTAGITVLDILQQSYGQRHAIADRWRRAQSDFISAEDLESLVRVFGAPDSISGHFVKPYSDLQTYHSGIDYWTMLREPLARCASHYQYQVQQMGQLADFERWVTHPGNRNFMTQKIAGCEDSVLAKEILKESVRFVGSMENFDESLVLFRAFFSKEPLNINYRRRNVAMDNTIKSRILSDPGTARLLRASNEQDLELYGFVMEQLYPEQRLRYPGDLDADLIAFSNRSKAQYWDGRRWMAKLKDRIWLRSAARLANRGAVR